MKDGEYIVTAHAEISATEIIGPINVSCNASNGVGHQAHDTAIINVLGTTI